MGEMLCECLFSDHSHWSDNKTSGPCFVISLKNSYGTLQKNDFFLNTHFHKEGFGSMQVFCAWSCTVVVYLEVYIHSCK